MKRNARIAAIALAGCLSLVWLTGCSQQATGGTPSSSTPESSDAVQEAPPSGEVTTIVFSTHNSETDIQITEIFKPYFEKLEELSGGTIQFEMHYNAELVGPADALEAVKAGVVDAAHVRTVDLGFEYDSIVEASYPTNNCNRMSRVYNELYDKYPEMQADYEGVQPLLLYTISHAYLTTTGDEVRTPDDLKGKMMIVSNTLQGKMMEALGATPVSCPPTEFYTTLEKGVADGSPAPVTSMMISSSWADVCTYVYDISTTVTTGCVVLNEDVYNKLPQACKDYIESTDIRYEWSDKIDQLIYEHDISGREVLKSDYGVTFAEPTEEELAQWTEALSGVLPAYAAEMDAKGEPGSDFLADYMALTEKYAAPEYQWE